MTNLIGVWPNVFRALEIAKTGGHSVSIHLSDDYTSGVEDYNLLVKFCAGWFDNFVNNGDIKIELWQTKNMIEPRSNTEKLEDIQARIEKTINFPDPEKTLCDASESLLKTAFERLELPISDIECIKNVASTIAKMESSPKIMAWHIAEAIQYKAVEKSLLCACFNPIASLFETYDYCGNMPEFDKLIAEFKNEVDAKNFDLWQESFDQLKALKMA